MTLATEADNPRAEAPVTIEVTPEMVEAGVKAFRDHISDDGASIYHDEDVVKFILAAGLLHQKARSTI